MQLREIVIRSVLLFPCDYQYEERDEALKISGVIKEFMDLAPSCSKLIGSQLVYKRRPKTDGLHLEFCILEAPQKALPYLDTECSSKGNLEDYEFRSDLQMIGNDLSRLPSQIQESLSAGTNLLDLLDSSEQGALLRVIRKSLRRGSHLYQLIQPELPGLEGFETPQLMPTGYEVFVTGYVHDIKKSFVRLKDFTFTGNVPNAIMASNFGKFIEILRPSTRKNESINALLLRALDESQPLRIKAVAAFRWRDGYPVYFELVSILTNDGGEIIT